MSDEPEDDADFWLDELRQIVHEHQQEGHLDPLRVDEAMILFDTLDEHLSAAGRLPAAWRVPSRPLPKRRRVEPVDLPPSNPYVLGVYLVAATSTKGEHRCNSDPRSASPLRTSSPAIS